VDAPDSTLESALSLRVLRYDTGDVGGRDLAGHYMEAIRWSARATDN
jgi:hypothetical protein